MVIREANLKLGFCWIWTKIFELSCLGEFGNHKEEDGENRGRERAIS